MVMSSIDWCVELLVLGSAIVSVDSRGISVGSVLSSSTGIGDLCFLGLFGGRSSS